MPTPSYLTGDDIKASVAVGFDLEPYLNECDQEIESLAESLGVTDPDDIETEPLHHVIKRYGIAYVLMRLTQDMVGANNTENLDVDKYGYLFDMYRKDVERLRKQISAEMYTGQVDEIRDRAINTGTIYRG